jgi:ketosteroid isomerase-like protein
MKADSKTEAEVMAVINQVQEAFNKRDLNSIPVLFSPDPDLVFYGTGADEKGMGLDGVKADWERAFAQSDASSMELLWSSVSAAGSVAWGAFDGVARATVKGQEISFPLRFTSVLEQRGGRWLIVQSHASTPSAGQKEGESWPTGSS